MCAHLRMKQQDGRKLARELGADVPPEFDEHYHAAERISPSEPAWILTADDAGRHLVLGRFGFTHPDRKRLLINARAETVNKLPSFRDAFVRRRCLVPVDGFYEWVGEKGSKRPVCFHRPDGGVLLLYGLYEEEIDPKTGEHWTAFTVLTTTPNEQVAKVHDRMPVLTALGERGAEEWLAPVPRAKLSVPRLLQLLVPAPNELLIGEELPRPQRAAGPKPEKPIRLPRKPPKAEPEKPVAEQLKLF